MRTSPLALLSGLMLLVGCAGSSATQFTRFHLDVVAEGNGQIFVESEMAYDFADVPSHGIYLTYLIKTEIDRGRDRLTPVTEMAGGSTTTNARLQREAIDRGTAFLIGDEGRTVTGEHEYFFDYRVDGVVDSGTGSGGGDEIFWNVIGSNFDDPINDIAITLRGPGQAVAAECWAGDPGSTKGCDGVEIDGASVTFTHARLEPGEGLTIGIAYPPQTFLPQTPQIVASMRPPPFPAGHVALGLGLAGAVGYLAYALVARVYRDEKYLDLPVGLPPSAAELSRVGKAPIGRPRVAVAFEPPAGLTPAEAIGLWQGGPDPNALMATVVDFAVRGHVSLTTLGSAIDITRLGDLPTSATRYERALFDALFARGDTCRLPGAHPDARRELETTDDLLVEELVSRGWLRPERPRFARAVSRTGFILGFLCLLVLGAMVSEGEYRLAAYAAIPVALFAGIGVAPPLGRLRTAAGYARYAQVLAFNTYLRTAEAEQLRFEAGEDVFARYLPYAVAFGIVRRWIKVFQKSDVHVPATYAWLNGGAANLFTDSALRSQLLAGLSAGSGAGGYGGAFSVGGGGVGAGVGGGGGGRW